MVAQKFDRRQFLKLAGTASALTFSTSLGYRLWQAEQSDRSVRFASPYAVTDRIETLQSDEAKSASLLVLLNERSTESFGTYLAEILRAEGITCFQVSGLTAVKSTALEQFELILLAEGPLNATQAELLAAYVARGGRLVAMRPDVRLAPIFGVTRVADSRTDGYLRIDTGHLAGQGLASQSLQIHAGADLYRLAGAEAVAWLTNQAGDSSGYPAVTLNRFGEGQAALWAFDLAHSVVYTRQGNPAWRNQERDGREGIRAHDAFVDWIDLDRIQIPQADEQMRLLSQLLSQMLADVQPLPRLWYFPGSAPSMLIATGDSHANPATAIEDVLNRVERWGGRMSIYYAPPAVSRWRRVEHKARWWAAELPLVGEAVANPTASPSPSDIVGWRERGHEFAFHPDVADGVDVGYRRSWQEFSDLDYTHVPSTVRTHRVLWRGWVETARVQASYELGMDLDYYHVGPSFQKKDGTWVFGHFTGSGLPMKFVDESGRILNIYQQLTQLVDEHLFQVPWGSHVNLSPEAAVDVSRRVLRRSLDGAYAAIGAQFHVDPFVAGSQYARDAAHWLEGTLNYAQAQGIPIWSAAQWLHFNEVRHNTTLEEIRWRPLEKRLSFRVEGPRASGVELTVMMPMRHQGNRLAWVEVDERTIEHHERRIGGIDYCCVSVDAGLHRIVATYV